MPDHDEPLAALDELIAALEINVGRIEQIIERAKMVRHLRGEGLSWTEIVERQERPLIVEMLTQNLSSLSSAGSRLRRHEAKALHDEGVSMERIGQLFGVTRQRVSELLRNERGAANQG